MHEKTYLVFLKNLLFRYNGPLQLAIIDNNLKYRRTLIGPAWISITQLITLSLLALVWAKVFNLNLKEYLPRLYIGMTCFSLVSHYTSAASTMIGQYGNILQNLNTNLSMVYGRFMFASLINFFHFFPIYFIFFIFFDIGISFKILLFIPGIVLVFLNGIWMSLVISWLSSRYRDLTPLIDSIMGAATLITPILWDKKMLGEKAHLVYLNPFTSFVECLRDPLMNYEINYNIYIYLIVFLLFGNLVAFFLFKKKRTNLTFWI